MKMSELKAKVKALQIIQRKQQEIALQADRLRMKIEIEIARREMKLRRTRRRQLQRRGKL